MYDLHCTVPCLLDRVNKPQSSQLLNESVQGSVDELIEVYNKGVQSIIYHHAAPCSKIITLKPEAPAIPKS